MVLGLANADVVGDVIVHSATRLKAVEVGGRLLGALQLWNCDALEEVNLPSVTSMAELRVESGPGLRRIRAPLLREVTESLYVGYAPKLASLEVPALTKANVVVLSETDLADLTSMALVSDVASIDIIDNDRLVSLADLGLVTMVQHVGIYRNDALVRIDLPITSARTVTVADNPVLTACVIDAWLDGVGGVQALDVHGNAGCP